MIRSSEYRKNSKELLDKYKCCELCGDNRGLEVHHSIPYSLCLDDSKDNLIVVCGKCHSILHRGNRSILTKIGISKITDRNKELKFVEDFYKHFWKLTGSGENPTFLDTCNFINKYFGLVDKAEEVKNE